jgi:hypothetical protein
LSGFADGIGRGWVVGRHCGWRLWVGDLEIFLRKRGLWTSTLYVSICSRYGLRYAHQVYIRCVYLTVQTQYDVVHGREIGCRSKVKLHFSWREDILV